MNNSHSNTEHLDLPPESVLLNQAYKHSGLTAADLSTATGISVGAIRIALQGLRYYKGRARTVAPPDHTLAKLAGVLGLTPTALHALGRTRAAELVDEGQRLSSAAKPIDMESVAAIAGRAALARQVLGLFSADELRTELARRESSDDREQARRAQEDLEDLADTLRGEQWPH